MKNLFSFLSVITLAVMMIGVVVYFVTGIFYKPLGMAFVFFVIFAAASKSKKFQK